MQINFGGREIALKLVYYGPALSGKTTNLRSLHQLTTDGARGRLMTLETKDDRTLFFDMLPLALRAEGDRPGQTAGMTLRIKIFTVPGQVLHASTRKLVLQGADGVVFVADSQISETEHNAASFFDLRQNLKDLRLSVKEMPLVIQFNKRDLDKVRSDEELSALARRGREPVFRASAVNGQGVLETFFGLMHLTWSKLDGEHQLGEDARHRVGRALADGGAPARHRHRRVEAALVVRRREAQSHRSGAHVNAEAPNVRVEDLVLDGRIHLEDLVDRNGLDELCKSRHGPLRDSRAHLLERGRNARGRDRRARALRVRQPDDARAARVRGDRRGREGARRGRRGRRAFTRASPAPRTASSRSSTTAGASGA